MYYPSFSLAILDPLSIHFFTTINLCSTLNYLVPRKINPPLHFDDPRAARSISPCASERDARLYTSASWPRLNPLSLSHSNAAFTGQDV